MISDSQTIYEAVKRLRRIKPDAFIACDVIAGFPTETEADFETTYHFIESQKLCGLHVFSYSSRPNTRAAAWPQLSPEIIKSRAEKLRALDQKLRADFAASLVGTVQEVFIEEYNTAGVRGVTSNFQQVILDNAPADLHGLVKVKISSVQGTLCKGILQ